MSKVSKFEYADGIGNLIYLHPNNEKVWKNHIFISADELPFSDDDSKEDTGKQDVYRPLDTDFPDLSERPKEWQKAEAKYQKILRDAGIIDDSNKNKK